MLAALLAAVFAPALSHASQAPALQHSKIIVKSEQDFASLDDRNRFRVMLRLVKSGNHDIAGQLLRKYPLQGKFAQPRTLFLEGMIAKGRNDYRLASKKFRSALAIDPNLSLVRAELAHTLYLLEEDDGARHHLNLLKSSAPNAVVARQFDNFIDAIDARRPWTFDAYISMAPSTNFNNGTSEEIIIVNGLPFRITGNSREKSGVGIRGGANAGYTLRAGKDLDFIVAAGVNFVEYEGKDFDDIIVSQSIFMRRQYGRGAIYVGGRANQRWSGRYEKSWSIGPEIRIVHQIAPKTAIRTKLRHNFINYDVAEYREGWLFNMDNRLSYSLRDGTIGYLIGGLIRGNTQRDYLDYWGLYGGIGVYHEAPYGITLYSETKVGRQLHDEEYLGLGFTRKDTRVEVNMSLTKRDFDWYGFAPQLLYTYIRNFSNSPFDKFETHGANVTLTKSF